MLTQSGIGRVRLASARAPARLPRVAIEDAAFIADYYSRLHSEAAAPASFDLASLGPMRVQLGGPGLIWSEGRLLDDNATVPIYVRAELDRAGSTTLRDVQALKLRRERRLALVFHGWGVQVYGHFLIEMLPKLLLARYFSTIFAMAQPVLDRQMSGWLIDALRDQCGIDLTQAIWFDSAIERLDLDHAVILPLLTRAEGYHPFASPLIDGFVARHACLPAAPSPRLFVARGDFSNQAAPRRRLVNEAELATIAADRFGFAVINPERLAFTEQIGLFAQARVIVGQTGSGMHNALFAGPGAMTGVIRFSAPDQSAIAALRGQGVAYLTEGVAETEPGVYHADAALFTRFLECLIELS